MRLRKHVYDVSQERFRATFTFRKQPFKTAQTRLNDRPRVAPVNFRLLDPLHRRTIRLPSRIYLLARRSAFLARLKKLCVKFE